MTVKSQLCVPKSSRVHTQTCINRSGADGVVGQLRCALRNCKNKELGASASLSRRCACGPGIAADIWVNAPWTHTHPAALRPPHPLESSFFLSASMGVPCATTPSSTTTQSDPYAKYVCNGGVV
jgi:hypothetical protein